jgi:hypothetical protein
MSTVNRSIIDDGLILYLDAANSKSYVSGSTTWTDISKNSNTGTLTNSPTYSAANNGTIVFDGTNDYFNNGNQISDVMNTIDIWVNMLSTSPCPILYYGSDAFDSNSWTWGIAVFPSSTHGFNEGPLYYPTTGLYTDTVNLNVWKNYTLVRNDNSNVKLYKNGILVGTKIGSGITSVRNIADRLYIGKAGTTYGNFSISSIKIYNRTLSSTEIQQNYQVLLPRFI